MPMGANGAIHFFVLHWHSVKRLNTDIYSGQVSEGKAVKNTQEFGSSSGTIYTACETRIDQLM
jgi:hypothetical protein